MSGRATAIFVGAGSPTIPANNLPSQKPAPTGILWLIDRTSYETMTEAYPRQGEVYLVRALRTIGDTKKRPVAVVSIDSRNELSRTVLIVPFTSDLTGGETPTQVLITAR